MAEEHISYENLSEYDGYLRSDANILKRNTNYVEGNIVNKGQVFLKCTQSGKTKATTLSISGVSVGDTLVDGTAEWEVVSVNGIPQGSSGIDLPEWEQNTEYKAGTYLVYRGTAYKVINDFTSGTTFDDTDLAPYVSPIMKGATSSANGEAGMVPKSTTADTTKFLCGDGTWKSAGGSGASAIVDTLFEGSAGSVSGQSSVNVNLTKSYKDYDVLGFYLTVVLSGYGKRYIYREVKPTHITVMRDNGIVGDTVSMCWGFANTDDYADIQATSTDTTLVVNYNKALITKIEGIKFVNPNEYSTTEKRIGTWIDGKPLYKVTLVGTCVNNFFAVSVASLSIDNVYDINGVVVINGTLGTYYLNSNNFGGFWYSKQAESIPYDSVYVSFGNANSIVGLPYYITIKYTKTTD